MSEPLRPFGNNFPKLGERVYVDPSAVLIGDVQIGDDSSVWPMAVARGDVHWIRIGRHTSIQDGSVLHVTHDHGAAPGGHSLSIGDEVTVGHNATLHGCQIGDRCLIGMGAVVLDGAVLEAEVLLAAGSLVPPGKHLEGGYLWMGNPVRRIRPLSDAERQRLAYSAAQYVKLKDRYRA